MEFAKNRNIDTFPSANTDTFISAMGYLFTLVTVVTTDGPAGRMAVTVSSATSVSADPPIMLACINRRSPVNQAIHMNGVFCINFLAVGQEHISDTFAGRSKDGAAYSFDQSPWRTGPTNAPILPDAVAAFDCVLQSSHGAGTHTAFFGRVLHIGQQPQTPLLYGARAYSKPHG